MENIIKNLDDWATRLVERVFIKETDYVPASVCVISALRFVARVVATNQHIISKETALKLLAKELDDLPSGSIKA